MDQIMKEKIITLPPSLGAQTRGGKILVDPMGHEGTGEAHHQDARSYCGDQVN